MVRCSLAVVAACLREQSVCLRERARYRIVAVFGPEVGYIAPAE